MSLRKRDWSLQSRGERTKRKLSVASVGCHKIEDFFPVLNAMDKLLKQNSRLRQQLTFALKSATESQVEVNDSNLLKILMESAKSNAGKKQKGKRYGGTLKEFCTLVFTLGGPQLYEILSKNLPIPSVTTCRNNLLTNDTIQEGVFRFKELKHYMEFQNHPTNKVLLSEDGTVVNGRIQFDIKTNQIVGFVVPLRDGVPVPNSFPAILAHDIKSYFERNKASKIIYVIMAQPLVLNAAPFCVAMFGTDNRFTHSDVIQRWHWMNRAAAEAGVEIVGHSSDGDGKLLKAMIISLFSTVERCAKWSWFHASLNCKVVMMQDTIHLLVKLKSKLLKSSEIIPMGKRYLASRGHIAALISNVSKDRHNLSECVLNQRDKMNFSSAQKLCDLKVCNSMEDNIPDSEATVTYLTMMREFCSAFIDVSLDPVQRVFLAFKWIFFLRLWRKWIDEADGYSLSHNFISSNSYSCMEINVHSLIILIRRFRDSEEPERFLPWLFTSQGCEEFFRQSRAMSPTQSTMVTYSVLDLQHRTRRVDFLSQTFCNLQNDIEFPRLKKLYKDDKQKPNVCLILPEDYIIEETVERAFKAALTECLKFKIAFKNAKIPSCPLPSVSPERPEVSEDFIDDPDEDIDENICTDDGSNDDAPAPVEEMQQDEELDDVTEDLLIVSSGSLGMKSYEDVTVSPTGPFILVADGEGRPCIIKKTSLIYLLRTGDSHISSDRLLRVMESQSKETTSVVSQNNLTATAPVKEDEVTVGQWCAFKSESNSIVIGRILAFSYLSGSSWRNQQYSAATAPVNAPDSTQKRGLGTLCQWYNVQKNARLQSISMDLHGYYAIENYLCTIPRPLVRNKVLSLACPLRDIKKFLKT